MTKLVRQVDVYDKDLKSDVAKNIFGVTIVDTTGAARVVFWGDLATKIPAQLKPELEKTRRMLLDRVKSCKRAQGNAAI